METFTVVAPSGSVSSVRSSAPPNTLGEGQDLVGGGVVWDLPLSDFLKDTIEAAGALTFPRKHRQTIPHVLGPTPYSLA